MKNTIFDVEYVAKVMKKLSFYFLLILFLVACNSTKYVPENEHLLTQNYIFIDSVKNKGITLDKYILQKPNPKLLGLAPVGLYLYNLGSYKKPKTPLKWGEKHPKKYKFIKNIFSEKQSIAYANSFIKLNNWFLDYDAPVIVSNNRVKRTTDNLWAYYKTKGYFESQVSSKIDRDSVQKKAKVTYYVNKGKPTLLDSINLKIESAVLDSIYKDSGLQSLLISGNQYDDNTFRKEASNLVKLFRNNGIRNFSEAALGFYVDSTRVDHKTNVDFLVAKDYFKEVNGLYIKKDYKVHRVTEINVTTDYTYTQKDNIPTDTTVYKGINFLSHEKLRYNPKYLSESIFFKPGDVYKDTLRNLTRNHLKSLKNFKSTNISFTQIKGTDDALRMNLFLSPKEKYTLGYETELTHSNIRNIGSSAKFSITNRNALRGAELFKIAVLGSYFNANNGPGWEVGADASIEFPRFIAPFGLSKLVPKRMSPRTLFSLGFSIQKNIGLDRQTFTFLSDYKWQYNRKKTIQLEIFNTQYIQNLNVNRFFNIYSSEFSNLDKVAEVYDVVNSTNFSPLSPSLDKQASESIAFMNAVKGNLGFRVSNPNDFNTALNIQNRYNIVTSDFLVPILAYSYTYNSQVDFKDNNFSFFKARISNSGNVLGLFSKNYNANGKKTFLKIPLAQYFKTDFEYKKFWDVGSSSVFGVRASLGAIITYDNSDVPFTRSYFAGGSNDVRAWQTYELGPGSRNSGLEFNVGSFKLLTSAEYRFDLVGPLKGALFIDAGNIWDISGSEFVEQDAKFTGLSSLENTAIGSGIGIRYDLSFFVIRFDIGFKTYEPYLQHNKWFKNYNFESAVYNVGINYPF